MAENEIKQHDYIHDGKLKLQSPITTDEGEKVEYLIYDFDRITGTMLLNVLGDGDANGKVGVSNREALELFLRACAPEDNGKMTVAEMRTKMGARDMPVCMRLGASFFMRSYASGATSIGER